MYGNANLPEHVKAAHELSEKVFSQYHPDQQVEFLRELQKQLRFHQTTHLNELKSELESKTKIWGL